MPSRGFDLQLVDEPQLGLCRRTLQRQWVHGCLLKSLWILWSSESYRKARGRVAENGGRDGNGNKGTILSSLPRMARPAASGGKPWVKLELFELPVWRFGGFC